MRGTLRAFVAVAVVAATAPTLGVAAPGTGGVVRLLDVPFLSQSELLCGGAAAAMVMRFWRSTEIHPDAFRDLVDPQRGGINGADLVRALHDRGWGATSFVGDPALVQSQLAKHRPLVALIEDRPNRFHYVVVVGWISGRVVVHDPARAPFRSLDENAFQRAWSRSGRWTLLILPASTAPGSPSPEDEARREAANDTNPCTTMVGEGVRLAGAGDLEAAQHLLELTSEVCPETAGPWRELAGLHALKQEWQLAAAAAREALARDARDEHAARILATSLFVQGRADAALTAWNALHEPRLDLVRVKGLERMRHVVVERAIGLAARTPVTANGLVRARRRISELPGVMGSRVTFTPGEDGRADVDVAVIERPAAPFGSLALVAAGVRAVADREITTSFANLAGSGEVVSGSWRLWEHRPRTALTFSAPSPSDRLGGIWTLSLFDERQTYGRGSSFTERRRGVSLQVSDWATAGLHWQANVGVDRWTDYGLSTGVGGAVHRLAFGDRLTLEGHAAVLAGAVRTATAGFSAQWRSDPHNEGTVWLARVGVDIAGANAPLALWPGAGTGQARDALLRAHPLVDDGVIHDGVFGRRLFHTGAEWQRWTHLAAKPLKIAPALFVDFGRAAGGLPDSNTSAQADVGGGLRVSMIGMGVFRVDVARGVRDGATAVSIGWEKRR
jgi:Peptidase C39 family